jgi:putative tricarboxylic transport membrane protein
MVAFAGIDPAKKRLACALAAALVLIASTLVHAQQGAWRPERPVEIVVPTPPGGAIDALGRLLQKILHENRIVEVPLVVMNKGGGGGNLALVYLNTHAGDGHFLFPSTMTIMNNHILGRSKHNYTDYTPLAILFKEPMTMVTSAGSTLKSGRDIMEKLKGDPQSLSISIGFAPGGTNHLAAALLMRSMGIDVRKLKTVIFASNSESMTALLGGHVDLSTLSAAQALRAAQQGKLRILGITADKRGEGPLADIPTWKEQGFDVAFSNTRLLFGPKGMSAAQVAYWDAAIQRMVQNEEWKDMARKDYVELDYASSKQSPQRMEAMYKQIKGALIDVGMVKE